VERPHGIAKAAAEGTLGSQHQREIVHEGILINWIFLANGVSFEPCTNSDAVR
jgi:hypothetical protein